MRDAFNLRFRRRAGGMAFMIADMHRLEDAARLSMGDFEASILPSHRVVPAHAGLRIAGLGLGIIGVLLVAATVFPF